MKKTLLSLVIGLFAVCGVSKADALVLAKTIGGLSNNDGLSHTCGIHSNHKEFVGKEAALKEKIAKASTAKINTAQHIRQQVPSIELYAIDAKGKKVLLVADDSARETRVGPEAAELVDLINKLCK